MTEYRDNPDVRALTTALAAAQKEIDQPDWEEIAYFAFEQIDGYRNTIRLLQRELTIARQLNANQAEEIGTLRKGE